MRKLLQSASRLAVHGSVVMISLLSGYVLLEFAVFRMLLPVAPIDFKSRMPAAADVLLQTTKAEYLPQNYIALLGDSNAEGLGDWLNEQGSKRSGPHHSADIIQRETGRDVVSLGIGGAGSAEAMVLRPAMVFPDQPCPVFPQIDHPSQILVYFYEGNDIEDNLRFLAKVTGRFRASDGNSIDRHLQQDYAASTRARCHLQFGEMTFKLAEYLSQYYLTGLVEKHCGSNVPGGNRLVIGTRMVEAPALQGAAPHLDDDSLRRGLDVFDRALAWLRSRFPHVPVTIVYVPSPLSVYRIASETVTFCSATGGGPVARTITEQHHVRIRDGVAGISGARNAGFIDATPVLREAAATTIIHGPRDWDHLNKAGYHLLGSLVASSVEDNAEDD